MGILRALFGKKELAPDKRDVSKDPDLPAGISPSMIGLVKAISMEPLPITSETFKKLVQKGDRKLRKALRKVDGSEEISVSRAAAIFRKSLGNQSVSHLGALLGCDDRDVGRIAGDTLMEFGIDAVPALVNAVNGDMSDARSDAAAALYRMAANGIEIDSEGVRVGLSNLIRREPLAHFDVIAIAAAALGEIGESAVPELRSLLLDDSYVVRLGGVAGFAKLRGQAASQNLQEARNSESNFAVAEAIDSALEMIGDSPPAGQEDEGLQISGDQESSDAEKSGAATESGLNAGAPSPVAEALKDPEARAVFEEALKELGDDPLTAILNLLQADTLQPGKLNDQTKTMFGLCLAVIGEPAIPHLIDLMGTADFSLAKFAARTLAGIEGSLPHVRAALKSGNPSMRLHAAGSLQSFEKAGVEAIPDLANLIRNEIESQGEVELRAIAEAASVAAGALGKMGEAVLPTLGNLLYDDSRNVRLLASTIGSRLGKPALPLLLQCRARERNEVVFKALNHAIGTIEGQRD